MRNLKTAKKRYNFKWIRNILSIMLWVILTQHPLKAALAAEVQSPRTAALGGAGHAAPLLNDAIFMNPSFSSFLPTYSFGVNYATFSGTSEALPNQTVGDPFRGRNFSVSIQDGRSELFQAGVAYTKRVDETMVHVGASKAVIKKLGFGLGAKFFFNDPNKGSGRDGILSITGIPLPWLQASFIVDNVFQHQASMNRGLYREYILGTRFNVKNILIGYFDPHLTPELPGEKQFGYESGLEFVMMSDLFIRLGMFRNSVVPYLNSRSRGFGAGVGWVAPRISFDYGLSRAIEPIAATAHSFGATVYF